MTTYIWSNNQLVDKDTGTALVLPATFVPVLPMVVSDLEPYESPMTGKIITSKSEQREDLAKSGCRLLDPSESPTKGAIRNKKFAEKRGFQVSDQFRDWDSSTHSAEAQ
jgi:hypothetical protein